MENCTVGGHYFYGFQEMANYKTNSKGQNALAALKIASYFTIVFPIGVCIASSLCCRVKQVEAPSETENKAATAASSTLNPINSEPQETLPKTPPLQRQSSTASVKDIHAEATTVEDDQRAQEEITLETALEELDAASRKLSKQRLSASIENIPAATSPPKKSPSQTSLNSSSKPYFEKEATQLPTPKSPPPSLVTTPPPVPEEITETVFVLAANSNEATPDQFPSSTETTPPNELVTLPSVLKDSAEV